jgi:hypothetical protein
MNTGYVRCYRVVAAIFAGLVLETGEARAEFVVKRIRCADATLADPLFVHYNPSTVNQATSLRITRNGCRPKDGVFAVIRRSFGATIESWTIIPQNKYLHGVTLVLPQYNFLAVSFDPGAENAKGTFDFVYTGD